MGPFHENPCNYRLQRLFGYICVFIQEQGFSVIRFNDFESNNTKISGN